MMDQFLTSRFDPGANVRGAGGVNSVDGVDQLLLFIRKRAEAPRKARRGIEVDNADLIAR